jgi:hypothetical protein
MLFIAPGRRSGTKLMEVVLGGLLVFVLAIGPMFVDSHPAEDDRLLRSITIRSTTYFRGEVKPSAPCREILWYVKDPCRVWQRYFAGKIVSLLHFAPDSTYAGVNVQWRPLTAQRAAVVAAVLQTLGFPVQKYLTGLPSVVVDQKKKEHISINVDRKSFALLNASPTELPLFYTDCSSLESVHLNLNNVNQLISVMVKCGVLFEVRTGFLNNI